MLDAYINEDKKKWLGLLLLLVVALISYFVLAESDWLKQIVSGLTTSLDDKKATVVSLTAASATASVALTAIPGDVAMPIAENLADLSDYFLIVFGAIWLQKYLVGITGFVTFKLVVPTVCLLLASNVFLKKDRLTIFAKKLALFGVVFTLVIPTSVAVSNHIEATHQDSIEQTIKQAEKQSKKINSSQSIFEDIGNFVEKNIKKLENLLSNMIDAVAVLIITTCIIPLLVVFFFLWLMKLVFNVEFSARIPKLGLVKKAHGLKKS
ncbi:hypothetical protein [Streptococcus ovis]|uniref:hypothetical protein n=1 Tax=Streptococcus ovis TaxID=82806 RepID=UPI00035F208F|nr:hypothetical protein [Streptococcus ovis]